MPNQQNVPVTVLGTFNNPSNYMTVVVGDQNTDPPQDPTPNSYWVVVIDLTSLDAVVNEMYSGNNQVPPGLQPYIGNPNFLLILTTFVLTADNVPQGAFYTFLKQTGSGPLLDRAEQINEQLGTGVIGPISYILVATLAQTDAGGFEEFSFDDLTVMTFQLMPVPVGGQIVYTPIQSGT